LIQRVLRLLSCTGLKTISAPVSAIKEEGFGSIKPKELSKGDIVVPARPKLSNSDALTSELRPITRIITKRS